MSLLELRKVDLSFGAAPILENVNLNIESGERLCLIGRNGTGKTTLMNVIAGKIEAEDGEIRRMQGLKVARLHQEVDNESSAPVFEYVARGLGHVGELLNDYDVASMAMADDCTDENMQILADLQHKLEAEDGWAVQSRIDAVLSRLQLDPHARVENLSGGLKRRAGLAQALVQNPDILLLDEPTNHLDIESIEWLEDFLLSYKGTILFVTHDRRFLKKLATRIIELDRGHLTSWPGNYDNYLKLKQQALESEASENAEFDKKLAREEVWIRQGIKARRTRNEGRVRSLEKMRNERKQRRERTGKVKLNLDDSQRSGKRVIEAENITKSYSGVPLIKNFSTSIVRGDKIGLIGHNGCGKTTLLKCLLGTSDVDDGFVKTGTNLQVVYFDQHRQHLDETKSVQDNVADGSDQVVINGNPKHVISYLQDFLFTPARARSPVSALSGGERNRLLLAKLFAKPANLLVMDEPTNDLDSETLELLEELLVEYQGTLLLVSHDREFLDNVVTSSLVFDAPGVVNEYVGGYSDWLSQRPDNYKEAKKTGKKKLEAQQAKKPETKKLSYNESRELEQLPVLIEQLETQQEALHAIMADADFYQKESDEITSIQQQLGEVEKKLTQAYERWEILDG